MPNIQHIPIETQTFLYSMPLQQALIEKNTRNPPPDKIYNNTNKSVIGWSREDTTPTQYNNEQLLTYHKK